MFYFYISLYLTCLKGKNRDKDTILAIEKFNFTISEVGDLQSGVYPTPVAKETRREECERSNAAKHTSKHTFLGSWPYG